MKTAVIQRSPSNSLGKVFPWLVCAVAGLFYLYEYLLRVSPSVMTTYIMDTHHITTVALGSLTTFFYYIYAPMQIPVGALVDRYGARYLLTIAGLTCALGTYFFAVAHNLALAETGRFMVGFGSAFAFVSVIKLIVVWLPKRNFALLVGGAVAFGQIGGAFCQTCLPRVISYEGWKLTSYLSALIGVVLTLLIFFLVRDRKQIRKGENERTQKLFNGLSVTLKHPHFLLLAMLACLLYLPTSVFAEFWGVPYLKATHYLSSTGAAKVISMIFWGWAMGCPMVGWLSDHFKTRRLPMTVGASVAAVLFSIILFVPGLSTSHLKVVLFLFGLVSSTQILAIVMCCEFVPKKHVGITIGLMNALIMLGGFLVQPLVGFLLEQSWFGEAVQGVHVYGEASYQIALLILPIALFSSVFLTFFLKDDLIA